MGSDEAFSEGAAPRPATSGLQDTAVTFASRMLVTALGLVWAFALAKLLAPDGRGAYAVCTQYAGLLTVLFMLGTDVGCIYFVASKKLTPSEGVITILFYALAGSAGAIVVGLLLMQAPWAYFEKAPPESFWLCLAGIPLSFFSSALVMFLISLREFVWSAILALGEVVFMLGMLVLLVWMMGLGVIGAVLATLAASLAAMVSVLVLLRRRHGLTWAWPSRTRLVEVLSFGVRYYFGKISNLVNFQLGTLVLAFSPAATQAEVGLFAFGLTLADGVQRLPDTLTTVLIPRVAADEKGRVALVAQCNRVVTVAAGAALLVLAALAHPVFALVVPNYLPAVVIIWLLVPGVWVRCASKVFVPYLHSRNWVGITSVAVMAGAAVNAGLLIALLPVLGLPAAALAVVGNYFVSSAILAVAFHRCSGMGLREVWAPRWSDWSLLWNALVRWRSRAAAEGPAKV